MCDEEVLMVEKVNQRVFSAQTRNNFILDLGLLFSGLISALSGIYFLFLPTGYQGGRNPLYGLVIFFERHTWSDVHTWSSVIIMGLALLHIPLHWDWIVKMTRSGFRTLVGKSKLNSRSRFNLGINVLIGLSGLICGFSGLYFLFFPGGETILFTTYAWDVIHTWSGVAVIAAAILHFEIHWKWISKISQKYIRTARETVAARHAPRMLEEVPVGIKKQ
jgi:hypothetical protein